MKTWFLVASSVLSLVVATVGVSARAGDMKERHKQLVRDYMDRIDQPEFQDWSLHFSPTISFNGTEMPAEQIGGILAHLRAGFPDLRCNTGGHNGHTGALEAGTKSGRQELMTWLTEKTGTSS